MGKRPSFSPSTISPCGKMLGQRQRRPAIAPPRPLEYGCQSKENYAPIIGKPKYRAELILMLWLFLAHVCESELLIKSTMLTSRLVPSEHFRFDRGFCFYFGPVKVVSVCGDSLQFHTRKQLAPRRLKKKEIIIIISQKETKIMITKQWKQQRWTLRITIQNERRNSSNNSIFKAGYGRAWLR